MCWFGDGVYRVGDALLLTSGRPVPEVNFRRGEGVATVLRGRALAAFRAGGSQWTPISSRLMTAVLQLTDDRGSNQLSSTDAKLHVIVAYAPTYRSSRLEKDKFFSDLHNVLTKVSSDMYVIMGDVNARVGSRCHGQDNNCSEDVDFVDSWHAVRGPHGFGCLNEAGAELLTFLNFHNATICNTWFDKRPEYKTTWQHPKTHKWHCIDYVVVHQRFRRLCQDCRVVQNADCGSDHRMVCLDFMLRKMRAHRRKGQMRQRFDVTQLQCLPGRDKEHREAVKERVRNYQQSVAELLRGGVNGADGESGNDPDKSVDMTWNNIKSALVGAASDHLGDRGRRQPDWFTDSAETIKPLLEARRVAYNQWVRSGSAGDHSEFKRLRSQSRAAVRRAKNQWLARMAHMADSGRKKWNSATVWRSVKSMQRCYRGYEVISQ